MESQVIISCLWQLRRKKFLRPAINDYSGLKIEIVIGLQFAIHSQLKSRGILALQIIFFNAK